MESWHPSLFDYPSAIYTYRIVHRLGRKIDPAAPSDRPICGSRREANSPSASGRVVDCHNAQRSC